MLYCIIIPAACKGVFSHFCTTSVLAVGGAVCYTDNNYGKIQKPQEEMTVKQSLSFARRLTALVLAAVMLCVAVPAAFAEDAAPGATTIGGANTTLIPEEEENCLSWLFGSKDKITLPYLNIKGKGLRRSVSLETQVSGCVPPVFLWHTATDEMVNAENSLLFASALAREKIPYELHIYGSGVHGVSLGTRATVGEEKHVSHGCAGWFAQAARFLERVLPE